MKISTYTIQLVGAVAWAFSPTSHAADWADKIYLNADAGAIFPGDMNLHQQAIPASVAAFNPGIRTGIAVGYNLTRSFAVEIESGFLWDSLDTVNGQPLSPRDHIDTYSIPILANFLYKFTNKTAWTPYVGVGAGGIVGIFDGNLNGSNFDDSNLAFAFQAEAGLKYSISKNISLGIAYKFLGSGHQSYSGYTSPTFPLDTHSIKTDNEYVHGIFAGLNWNF